MNLVVAGEIDTMNGFGTKIDQLYESKDQTRDQSIEPGRLNVTSGESAASRESNVYTPGTKKKSITFTKRERKKRDSLFLE